MPPLVWGLPVEWSPAAIVGSCAPLLGKLIVTDIVSSGAGSCVKLIPSDTEPFGLTDSEVFAIVSKGKTPTVLDPLSVLPAASVKDTSAFNRPPSSSSPGVEVRVLPPTVDQLF